MADLSDGSAGGVSGRPSRVVLATPDRSASASFYSAVLGWDSPGMAEALDFFSVAGRTVAGLFELPPAAVEQGAAARWLVHVTVEGIDATVDKVTPADGAVLTPTFDLPGGGRMAILADPSGAEMGLWEPPAGETGAAPAGPGTLAWAELYTRSRAQAAAFYEQVLDWELHDVQSGEAAYMVATLDGVPVAGVMPIGAGAGDMPSHWMPYFAVTDTDAAVSEAIAMGGEVCAPVEDVPAGRLAVLRDPQGALLFVVAERE